MRFGILFLFVGLPLLELALLIKLGQSIGFLGVMGLIVLTGILGVLVLQTQGFAVMQKASAAISRGETGFAAMHDGAFLALAGVLLIAPGILTDILGLALLIPPIRALAARWSMKAFNGRIHVETRSMRQPGRPSQNGSAMGRDEAEGSPTRPGAGRTSGWPGTSRSQPGGPFASGPVIDGEFERIDDKPVDPKAQKPSRPSD